MSKINNLILITTLCAFSATHVLGQNVRLKTVALGDFEYLGAAQLKPEFIPFNQMLQGYLVKSRRFQLVERAKMDQALREQGLTESGVIGENAKQLGTLVGADYIVYGSVTDVRQNTASQSDRNRFTITVDLNIVDTAKGEIKLSDHVEVSSFGTVKQAIRETVNELSRKIIFSVYPITVAANKNGTVFLNYGNDYLSEGIVLDVFSQGNAIIDPATGMALANEESLAGQVRVSATMPRFSKAVIIHSDGALTAGMVCRQAQEKAATGAGRDIQPSSGIPQGPLRVAVGEFIYSSELDVSQTRDRSRSVETHAPTPSGGLLGIAEKILVGENATQFHTRNTAPPPPSPRYSDPTALTKKSDVLREMIINRLAKSGQFQVLERSRMGEIDKEINTISSSSGGFFDQTKLKDVKLQGADYIVHGTITRLSESINNQSFVQQQNSVLLNMTVALRIVDLNTTSIVSADNISCQVQTSKKGFNLFGLIGTASEQGGSMGELLESTAVAIVSKVTTDLRPITIVDYNQATGIAMVNYGEGIIAPEMDYAVYSQGKEIRDPYSGALLGRKETLVCRLQPLEITARFSKLKLSVEPDKVAPALQPGMICRPIARKPYMQSVSPAKVNDEDFGVRRSRPVF